MREKKAAEKASVAGAELDVRSLFGFEHLELVSDEAVDVENAVVEAHSKIGNQGEGVESDCRLKTDVRFNSATANGMRLYDFRYIGSDETFTGLMAQDLLANPDHADVVYASDDGYYRVDYARLGLQHLVTSKMKQAGAKAVMLACA